MLMKASQALSLLDGYNFVRPEVIQALAVPVIAHRLVLANEAKYSGKRVEDILEEVLQSVEVPT
jgi:MoxR-like ATPase